MTLSKGDIVLVQFPFTDLSQTKLRPALILYSNSTTNDVTLCFISSQNVNNLTLEEFAIKDSDAEFSDTGLRVSSKVRVTRIVTLNNSLVLRRLGKLGNEYMDMLNKTLKQAFQLS
ncbi:MAG: type II toxin-antitoxin system PemK/MazF family toxin [Rivularia sp. (in: Bacteria)]|nr:type II toxin-antitoxin system PemK/MazF family toxin [Rivularia sp. MS3]